MIPGRHERLMVSRGLVIKTLGEIRRRGDVSTAGALEINLIDFEKKKGALLDEAALHALLWLCLIQALLTCNELLGLLPLFGLFASFNKCWNGNFRFQKHAGVPSDVTCMIYS